MQVIANNLNFRNKKFLQMAHSGDRAGLAAMADALKRAGADILNISISLDGDEDERYMSGVVEAAGDAGMPLSIDSRNPNALRAAIKAAKTPVIANYVSADPSRAAAMDEILGIAAENGTDLVLYAWRKGTPHNADERLQIISELIERAGNAGVPAERLIIDPVIVHLAGGTGQEEQALAVQEALYGLNELVDPPVRTTCWLSNISAGAPGDIRPAINDTFLAMLAGLRLWSAYLDVTNKETMRTIRLIRALKNEALYCQADAAL